MFTTQFSKSILRHTITVEKHRITMRRGVRTSEITRLPTPLDTSNRFFLLQLHDIYYSRKKRLEYRRVVKIDVSTLRFPHQ